MSPNGLQLDAYIRVSRVGKRQGASFISPDEQRHEIEAWAVAHDATIVWHEPELNQSGGTMHRPIFNRIMDRIRTGQTQGIICAKLDRFSRSVVGALNTIEEMERHGAYLVCTRDNIDLTTPMGRAFVKMMLVFAELERERLTESFADASTAAIKRGAFIGPAPRGYLRGQDGILEVDPVQGPIVTEAYRRAARDGIHAAAAHLGCADITEARRILSNRVYLGELHHPSGVNLHAHDALTDLGTWTAAQTKPQARAGNGHYPLSGYARCGQCGGPLVGQMAVDRHGARRRRYRCANRDHTAAWKGTSVFADTLEDLIRATMREVISNGSLTLSQGTGGLAEAEEGLRLAESSLSLYASDIVLQQTLGMEAFTAGAVARREAVEAARTTYQEAARAATAVSLPAADQLDDDAQLVRSLGVVDSIVISPGRGSMAARVSIDWA